MDDEQEEIVGFSREDANAIISSLPGQGRKLAPPSPHLTDTSLIAVFRTPPGVFASNTAKDCVLQTFDGTDWVDVVDGTTPVMQSLRNLSASVPIGGNKRVVAVREYVTNRWIVIWEEC